MVAAAGVSTLSGTVKDQDDTPVVGATITLYSTTAFEDSWWGYDDIGYSWSVDSDEAGTYQFTDMPGTVFDVRVASDDHYTHTAASVDFTAPHEFFLSSVTGNFGSWPHI